MKEKYNDDNVFAKIIRGEIPSKKVFEDEDLLCFYDANPVAKVHVLVILKGKYIDYDDFFNFNLDIDREIDRMNQRFNRMHMAFNNAMKEQEKEMQKNKTLQSKDTNVRKEVKMNNGYETTIVEEKSPNLYSKTVNIRYVGDDKKKENNIKKSDTKRGEQKIKNDSKSKQMPEKKVKK